MVRPHGRAAVEDVRRFEGLLFAVEVLVELLAGAMLFVEMIMLSVEGLPFVEGVEFRFPPNGTGVSDTR